MDSQVKERVVGATVLVALGVLIFPWVLDGPDEPQGDDGEEAGISLPAVGEAPPVRTEIVELAPTRADTAAQVVESATTPPELLRDIEIDAGARSAAVSADEADAVPPTAPVPSPDPAPPQAEPAPAVVADSGSVAADAAWGLQLGAFSEMANAEQLASRVEAFGYSAKVSDYQSGGRTLHRVRVAGFASRELAEVAQSSLSAHGFRAQLVPPE